MVRVIKNHLDIMTYRLKSVLFYDHLNEAKLLLTAGNFVGTKFFQDFTLFHCAAEVILPNHICIPYDTELKKNFSLL